MTYKKMLALGGAIAALSIGCSQIIGSESFDNSRIGEDQVLLDDSGEPITLPSALDQAIYGGEDIDLGVPIQTSAKSPPLYAPTPASHPEMDVVRSPEVYEKFRAGGSVFIFVGPAADAEGRVAIIPGSIWWSNAGLPDGGVSSDENFASLFREEVDFIAGENADVEIILYGINRDDWNPYNAGLQFTGTPYENVRWYRGGTAAWDSAGLPFEFTGTPDWE